MKVYKKILEIGCGLKPFLEKGAKIIHLDKVKLPHVEVVHDLNKFPYPFNDNEFDEIIAFHILEHLDDLVEVMKELWRILKPNGILKIRVPHFSSAYAYFDPTHKHFFTLKTFDYWDSKKQLGKDFGHEVKNVKFKIVKKKIFFDYRIIRTSFLAGNSTFWHIFELLISRFFPATEIYFELKKF